jgi:hypothetical protein
MPHRSLDFIRCGKDNKTKFFIILLYGFRIPALLHHIFIVADGDEWIYFFKLPFFFPGVLHLYLFPIFLAISVMGCIAGTYAYPPTKERVLIYYASSDTLTHVAVSHIDRLVDYAVNTPEDRLKTYGSVETLNSLIDKNLKFMQSRG